MLNKLSYIISNIFNKSYCFKIPSKSPILLYGKPSKILEKTTNKKYFCDQLIDRNEINVFIFILTLIKGKIFFHHYAESFIKFVDPRIIITFIDNDVNFYHLKQFHPKKCFISVQNGYRFKGREQFIEDLSYTKKKNLFLEVDFYLTHNDFYSKFLAKYIKFKPIRHGSYKNNLIKIKKIKRLKKSILFISQFYPYSKNSSEEEHSLFYSLDKKLLLILEKYCLRNKLNLDILFRYSKKTPSRYEKEINFYKSFLKNFRDLRENNVYQLIDKYENIITIDSFLGYEALSRGKKVFFFHNRTIKKKNNFYKDTFGWPKTFKKNNFLLDVNEKKINQYFKSNLNLSYKKWFKINKRYINDFMTFDYKNKKLSKLIKSNLKKNKK